VPVFRVKSVPVRPATALQRSEVSGLVAAARTFAYVMTEPERQSWRDDVFSGLSGTNLWRWLVSQLSVEFWPFNAIEDAGQPGAAASLVDPSFDAAAGTVSVLVESVGASVDSVAVVAMSRPRPLGRVPRREDTRVLGVVPLGVSQDVSVSYFSRFGGFPVAGSQLLAAVRVVDPVVGVGSSIAVGVFVDVFQGSVCSVSAVDAVTIPFGNIAVEVFADLLGVDPFELLDFAVVTVGWVLVLGEAQLNGEVGEAIVGDETGVERSESVTFRWVDPVTLAECEDSIVLEVLGP